MQKKRKKPGPKLLSPYTLQVENLIKSTYLQLSEKDRRRYAAIEALKFGVQDYLLKPINPEELKLTIKRIMSLRKVRLAVGVKYFIKKTLPGL